MSDDGPLKKCVKKIILKDVKKSPLFDEGVWRFSSARIIFSYFFNSPCPDVSGFAYFFSSRSKSKARPARTLVSQIKIVVKYICLPVMLRYLSVCYCIRFIFSACLNK